MKKAFADGTPVLLCIAVLATIANGGPLLNLFCGWRAASGCAPFHLEGDRLQKPLGQLYRAYFEDLQICLLWWLRSFHWGVIGNRAAAANLFRNALATDH